MPEMPNNIEAQPQFIEEAVVTLSDLHLSAGPRLPDGTENILEDFLREEEFAALLAHLRSRYPEAKQIRLQLLGDIFDPLMIAVDGKFNVAPTEAVCLEQMRVIIQGHPKFFEALKEFLSDVRTEIIFFIGNHDFFLEWDSVQKLIEERLSTGHTHRLRFTYHELHRGVYYVHGNFEPFNAIDETERYLMPSENAKLKEPVLNYPYGSHLNMALHPALRRYHPYIGRLKDGYHSFIVKEAATRNWKLAVFSLRAWIGHFFQKRVLGIFTGERGAGVLVTLKMIRWLFTGYQQEEVAEKTFIHNPKIKHMVCGHDHDARSAQLPHGTFLNTGTWALIYEIRWHNPPNAPWGFQLLTRMFSYISHLWHRPEFIRIESLPVVLAEYGHDYESVRLMNFEPAERMLHEISVI